MYVVVSLVSCIVFGIRINAYSVAELDLYTSSNLLLLPTRLCPDEAHVAFCYDYGAVFDLCEIVCVLVFVSFVLHLLRFVQCVARLKCFEIFMHI